MGYLDNIAVLDIETTGLNPNKCAILSVGIISYSDRINEFYKEYYPFEGAEVMEAGMKINGFELDKMNRSSESGPKNVVEDVRSFLKTNRCNVTAGQNPSFDRNFVNAYAERYNSDFMIPIWMLDLHSVCMGYMIRNGIEIPRKPDGGLFLSGDAIMEFVGLGAEPKPHNALNGAKYEFEALCRILYGESVLPDFSDRPVPVKFTK
ncbi:MAG: exonuclease domain-containing protein [Candidatus Micrarchaeaceae archaeon]